MPISSEAKEAIRTLREEYATKIDKERLELEKRLTEEFLKRLKHIARGYGIHVSLDIFADGKDDIGEFLSAFGCIEQLFKKLNRDLEAVAKTFINHEITENSIKHDPYGWDGCNSMGAMEDHTLNLEELNNFDFENGMWKNNL